MVEQQTVAPHHIVEPGVGTVLYLCFWLQVIDHLQHTLPVGFDIDTQLPLSRCDVVFGGFSLVAAG